MPRLLFTVALIAAFAFHPSLAEAHSAGNPVIGWAAGFNHPLRGWDHLTVMVVVGLWAAQHRGRARWAIPLAFLAAMACGGMAGAAGFTLPLVEPAILVSVVTLGALVLSGRQFAAPISMAIVALFALFHGYAHGQELPIAAALSTYGAGFLLATALLHLVGYAFARLAVAIAGLASPALAFAQQVAADPRVRPSIPEIIVTGRQDSLLGLVSSAAEGTVGPVALEQRPILRTGEVLETVPGVIITQHAGGGKANQYFLRGFNLDHGTDFLTTLDGMPINLPSHAHGQGYADLNIVIPELIARVDYQKGDYYAENGDFSSAGAAHLQSVTALPRPLVKVEGGMYGYGRLLAAGSSAVGSGTLLAAVDVIRDDGPWTRPDHFLKKIGVVTYSEGSLADGFSITARGYHGRWNSTDQIAASAVTSGLIPFYGSLNPTDGGNSRRYSLQGEWHRSGPDAATRLGAYAFYYDLNLFSDFTYYLVDPIHGDQFEQRDKRLATGLTATHSLFRQWGGHPVEITAGVQVRNDVIRSGLFQTENRQRIAKIMDDGAILPDAMRQDGVVETSIGFYVVHKEKWSDHVRTVFGLREDVFTFAVNDLRPENAGHRAASVASPKASLILGPWSQTEVYVQGGLGYHSNDARGVLTHVDPVTGAKTGDDGNPVAPATPLVRSVGAEVGVRTLAMTHLQSTISLWWLDLDSELVFSGDGGTTEPSRPSRRYGIEVANYYTPFPWLTLHADLAFSRARYRDQDPVGTHIPEGIESVVSAGAAAQSQSGLFGSLRLRYFGPRPLIEDNSLRSSATIMLNGRIGWRLTDRWTIAADVFNLLSHRDHDIDYAYESRVTPLSEARTQLHFHPVEPRQARLSLSARF